MEEKGLAILLGNKNKDIYAHLVRDSPRSLVKVSVSFVVTTSLVHKDF